MLPSESEVEQHEFTAYVPRVKRTHTMATHYMVVGEDVMPITIPAGYDGMTKAFFANVVFCKDTSHGYAERALTVHVLSTVHQKSDTTERPRTQHHRRQPQSRHAHPNRNRIGTKPIQRHQLQRTHRTSKPSHPMAKSINDFKERQIATMGFDGSVLKRLVRHAAWTLTTCHVGSDGRGNASEPNRSKS